MPNERLGHLDADVAGADDHGSLRARIPVERVENRGAVVQGLHAEHALGVDARQVGHDRHRTHRDDELVVRVTVGLASLQVADVHPPAVEVDALDPGTHPQIDPVLAMFLRRTSNELVRAMLEVTGDPVRDPAGAVRRVAAAVERNDG